MTLPKAESPLRISSSTQRVGEIITDTGIKIPVSVTSFGGIENLPPKEEGVIYVVSLLTCQAAPDRDDFYIVNETVRDKDGRIVGCRSLSCNPYYNKNKRGDTR